MHGCSKWPCGLLTVFLAAFILAGCKDDKPGVALKGDVSLTLDWRPEPEFGGFYAAQQNGAFAKHNLDVTIKSAGEGARRQASSSSFSSEISNASGFVISHRCHAIDSKNI